VGLFITFIPTYVASELTYEPETEDYLNAISIVNDNTVYNALTAQEITGRELWTAFDAHIVSLKNAVGLTLGVNNLSTVFDIIYPIIGGTSTQHKYNAVNPLDTDAAHRLTFAGGWTHSETGITPNGTNGYANTYWNSTAKAGTSRFFYGRYQRVIDTQGLHGTWDLTTPTSLYDFTSAGSFTIDSVGGIAMGSPRTRFHAVMVRSGSTKVVSNNANVYNAGSVSYTLCNANFYLGARNNNTVSVNNYTNGELSYVIMTGSTEITDQQALDINAAVDALQLALNRNV
jgi:hypothetical protein